jgi:hypothetical protein
VKLAGLVTFLLAARTAQLLELPDRLGRRFLSAGNRGVGFAKRFLGLTKLGGRTVPP